MEWLSVLGAENSFLKDDRKYKNVAGWIFKNVFKNQVRATKGEKSHKELESCGTRNRVKTEKMWGFEELKL